MPLKTENKINLTRALETGLSTLEKEFAIAIADTVRDIKQRTRGGSVIDGGSMRPYTSEYAKLKGGTGRSKRNTKSKSFFNAVSKSTKPDLTLSGDMLKAITYKTNRISNKLIAEIFFSRADQEGKAKGNNATRPFFGLSNKQKTSLFNFIKNYLKL